MTDHKQITHLYASEMVTASGRPTGTATTTMVTAKMKKCSGPSTTFARGNPLSWMHHLERGLHSRATRRSTTYGCSRLGRAGQLGAACKQVPGINANLFQDIFITYLITGS